MKIYQVRVKDFPVHDHLLYWDQALNSYQWYKGLGFKNVKIVDTTTT